MGRVRAAAFAAILALAACATGGTGASHANQEPGQPARPDEVIIYNFAFVPKVRTIPVGTTIIWINHDIAAHTVTRNSGLDQFDSGNMQYDAVFRHTFTQPGTYDYICFYHPGMKGRVVVTVTRQAAGASPTQ